MYRVVEVVLEIDPASYNHLRHWRQQTVFYDRSLLFEVGPVDSERCMDPPGTGLEEHFRSASATVIHS